MNVETFREAMAQGEYVQAGSQLMQMFHKLAQEALKITTRMNTQYHSPEELNRLFGELTGKEVPEGFCLFPPFHSECGKNITIGKNVFINACCKFQDQGGITIGHHCFIGHNVTIATLNHDYHPEKRSNMTPLPVVIGNNVWIGSNSTILPGITISDGAIIGAGSLVTKDIAANVIAAGNPAKIIKKIEV